MITVALLVVGVPSLFGIVSLGLRRRSEGLPADLRGIALQTVIVMVVLLVIAGGVAAVLLTRGQQAVSDLEEQNVTLDPSNIPEALCTQPNFSWDAAGSTCAAAP